MSGGPEGWYTALSELTLGREKVGDLRESGAYPVQLLSPGYFTPRSGSNPQAPPA